MSKIKGTTMILTVDQSKDHNAWLAARSKVSADPTPEPSWGAIPGRALTSCGWRRRGR